jgi:hypothetical protein
VQKFAKKKQTHGHSIPQDGSMHNILLLGGLQRQNNDGEALVLACSSPVLGCVQPALAGGDTYKKTANAMTSPGVMGRS